MKYTAEFFKDTKIKIESEEHGKYVQELAFKCGYKWLDEECFNYPNAKYLYFNGDFAIKHGTTGTVFLEHEFKEITIPMLEKEIPWPDDVRFTVRAANQFWRYDAGLDWLNNRGESAKLEGLKNFGDFAKKPRPKPLPWAGFWREMSNAKKEKPHQKEDTKVSVCTRDDLRDYQKKSLDYLNECAKVQAERGKQYDSEGTGERSFEAAAQAFNALRGRDLSGSDICLIQTCLKVVRQNSNTKRVHEDSLLDAVSYMSLWAEEINKEVI